MYNPTRKEQHVFMSEYRDQLQNVVRETILHTQAVTPRVASALATLIVHDLFASNNWEAVQEYLNERVMCSLPDVEDESETEL
jgi:hypothetical protein